MKFLKALAQLFSRPAEQVAKAARDPSISEPVWMMLRSIRKNPRRWKVELDLPGWDKISGRHPTSATRFAGMTCLAVTATVVDTITGERYVGGVYLEDRGLRDAILAKACKRPPEPVWVAGLFDFPTWMTRQEANALVAAVCEVYATRMDKVTKRRQVRQARKVRLERERKEHAIQAERDRLIKIYEGER